MGAGQVLHCPYNFEQTKIVVKEMIDQLALDLVDKRLVTDQIVLTIGYDIKNLEQGMRKCRRDHDGLVWQEAAETCTRNR